MVGGGGWVGVLLIVMLIDNSVVPLLKFELWLKCNSCFHINKKIISKRKMVQRCRAVANKVCSLYLNLI